MGRVGQVGHVQNVSKGREHLHLLQNLSTTGGAQDQETSALWWVLLQQNQKSLEGNVGVSRSNGTVIQKPLHVVNQDARHLRAVSIVKDLADLHALGTLGEAHHVLRTADLDEWEAWHLGQLRSQSSLASIGRSLQQDADQTRAIWAGSLLNKQSAIIQHILNRLAPRMSKDWNVSFIISSWTLLSMYQISMPRARYPSRTSWEAPKAGLTSFSRACMKSARQTTSFSAASGSISTLEEALTSLFKAQDWAALTKPEGYQLWKPYIITNPRFTF